jgi:hypothetical protein
MAAGNANAAFGTPLFQTLVNTPQNLLNSTTNLLGSTGTAGIGRGGMMGGMGGMNTMGGGSSSSQASGSYGALGVVYGANGLALSSGLPAGVGAAGVGSVRPGGALAAVTPLPSRMQGDLQALLARSDLAPAVRDGVTFGLDANGTVVLRGTVASPADVRTIESLVRFAPGVRSVRSEMTLR